MPEINQHHIPLRVSYLSPEELFFFFVLEGSRIRHLVNVALKRLRIDHKLANLPVISALCVRLVVFFHGTD